MVLNYAKGLRNTLCESEWHLVVLLLWGMLTRESASSL